MIYLFCYIILYMLKHTILYVYTLFDLFANDVVNHLCNAFDFTMPTLDQNMEKEGLTKDQDPFVNMSFTYFGITRDHSCHLYYNTTNYEYGFIVWLHARSFLHYILIFYNCYDFVNFKLSILAYYFFALSLMLHL